MRFLKKILPSRQKLKANKHLRWLGKWCDDPRLWHFNRSSVAVGVAVGLFAAVLPLPAQMLLASVLAIIFRGNIPLAAALTWISNPITMLPLIYLICKTGTFFTHEKMILPKNFYGFTEGIHSFSVMWEQFVLTFMSLGKNFLIGLPIVAITLSLLGYFLVHLGWYMVRHIQNSYAYRQMSIKK